MQDSCAENPHRHASIFRRIDAPAGCANDRIELLKERHLQLLELREIECEGDAGSRKESYAGLGGHSLASLEHGEKGA